jgi:hypothetical protein
MYVQAHQKMTQRPIVSYLSLKGMSACETHDDIVATFGPDAVSYSSVTSEFCEARFPLSKPEPYTADVQRDLDDSDQAILAALVGISFASGRQLSRLTDLPSTTVYRRLTQSLGFVARHLRRVLNAGYYITEILPPLSQWYSIEAARENCWCMRTMHACIPPSY